ncbi:MAG TPA: HRDC domain-containing protein [Gemmatimonadaceae bacterium]|nr:HRDC domain-containing protein [Gemmatimonadaceae bacterium]
MSAGLTVHEPLYIDTTSAADRFLSSVEQSATVAVDTEGASFHRFVDRIYLLQMSTRDLTAVLDPLAIGTPAPLGRILESDRIEKVFHDADYDLRLLHQDYGWNTRRLFDTRVAAQLLGIRAFGLAALLERSFGLRLDKKHQRADWSMRPLPRDMLDYASQDTMYLLELRDRLASELESAGRWSWAEEEFERLEGTRWEQPDGEDTGYMRIKGARDLDRRELAIFRELVRFRDGIARELDRATFRVAGNEALFAVAKERPQTLEALAAIKGVPRGIAERRGAEMLAAVRRGMELPEDQLPRFPRAPRWDRDADFDSRVNALRVAREEAAQRLGLDPGFLCAREKLETIARKKPKTLEELAEVPDLRRWQIEVLGPAFLKALEK